MVMKKKSVNMSTIDLKGDDSFSKTVKDINNDPINPEKMKPINERSVEKVLRNINEPTAQYVDLSMLNIGSDDIAKILQALKNSTITSVDISMNILGDKGATLAADFLENDTNIVSLSLSSNSIGVAGAISLTGSLRNNGVLSCMNLNHNHISDLGAEAISEFLMHNNTLTSLNLNSNAIGNTGLKAIASSLRSNSCLSLLSLKDNDFEDEGAISIVESLQQNNTLTSLDLKANSFSMRVIEALEVTLTENSALLNFEYYAHNMGYCMSIANVTNHLKRNNDYAEIYNFIKTNNIDLSKPESCNYLGLQGFGSSKEAASSALNKNFSSNVLPSMLFYLKTYPFLNSKLPLFSEFVESLINMNRFVIKCICKAKSIFIEVENDVKKLVSFELHSDLLNEIAKHMPKLYLKDTLSNEVDCKIDDINLAGDNFFPSPSPMIPYSDLV